MPACAMFDLRKNISEFAENRSRRKFLKNRTCFFIFFFDFQISRSEKQFSNKLLPNISFIHSTSVAKDDTDDRRRTTTWEWHKLTTGEQIKQDVI